MLLRDHHQAHQVLGQQDLNLLNRPEPGTGDDANGQKHSLFLLASSTASRHTQLGEDATNVSTLIYVSIIKKWETDDGQDEPAS